MSEKKAIRIVVVSVALLALLVLAITMGGLRHNHASSSDANCPTCHFNHQPMERPLASHYEPPLAPVGSKPEPQEPEFTPSPEAPRLPARAPPSV